MFFFFIEYQVNRPFYFLVLPNFFVALDVPEFYIIGDKPLSGKLNVK